MTDGALSQLDDELEARVQERTAELRASLDEKDLLLREIHHRVKNSLQVVSSLIRAQARRLAEGEGREAVEALQTRLHAVALIHEQLHPSGDQARIRLKEYLRALSGNVFSAFCSSPSVSLELSLEEVSLAAGQAIPCGLIVSELLTNALKHAFPNSRAGVVRVELARARQRRLRLVVRDDGIGLPPHQNPRHGATTGLGLVRTLSRQLDARLEVVQDGGTTVKVSFDAAD